MNSPESNRESKDSKQSHETAGYAEQPMRLGGAELGAHRHVCLFSNSKDEEYRVLLPFIQERLDRGEKAFHIVDPELREEHNGRLGLVGINVPAAEVSGQLEVRSWQDAYLLDGHFDQDRMLRMIQDALDQGREQGFPLTRIAGHTEWALEDRPGVNDLLEYEVRLNQLLPRYKDPVICLYDLSKFGGEFVIDIMRTHPIIIIGGILQENPFFLPPDEFLLELRARESEAKRSVSAAP